jgi:hypothetical protein
MEKRKRKDAECSKNPLPRRTSSKKRRKLKKLENDVYSLAGGRAIRRLRMMKNLAQVDAASEANFSLSYLSNVERGNHAMSLSKFLSFSDGVHCQPEEICQLLCEEIAKCKNLEAED